MPKTRLLQSDRDAICEALIAHKFGPVEKLLEAEENALAEEVRAFVHGDYLKTMDRAPKGAYKTLNYISLSVDGKYTPLRFGGKYPNQVERRLFKRYTDKFTSAEPLMARVLDLAERQKTAVDGKQVIQAKTSGTLSGFRTFDALLESWPEAEKFITERWRTREGVTARQLPVALTQLSEALDLPPDDAASPEAVAA